MLRSIKELHGYAIHAYDGDIGKVHDFFFHDDTWAIRYLVVDTGRWLPGRKVLVATPALGKPSWEHSTFPVTLAREQVAKSPDIDTDMPVSRQQEIVLHNYYGWPGYWMDPASGVWPGLAPLTPALPPPPTTEHQGDAHLRSAREVAHFRMCAADGDVGRIGDLIVDDGPWVIRYAAVDTGRWLAASKVLVPVEWLQEFGYFERKATVNLSRAAILASPEYVSAAGVTPESEERIHRYYGRIREIDHGREAA